MRRLTFTVMLSGCALFSWLAFVGTPHTGSAAEKSEEAMRDHIAQIAKLRGPTSEKTYKQRNEKLNRLFQQYRRDLGGKVTARSVQRFHELIKQAGLTCFDDFRAVMTTPVRYVIDPVSRNRVPVFGPLGSDIINPWLAAMGVDEGKPLGEQPMYNLASDVLREHIDFVVIGVPDPNLSLDLFPPELRANAKWAYQRLNPTNRFDGGFDHPLFYITIREAAKKLFREDHPAAKLTMADIVVPQDQGGFGIRSCLLCHNRDHAGVYGRLLGQSAFYEAKAGAARAAIDALPISSPDITNHSDEINHAETMSTMFQLAANRVLDNHRNKITPEAVRAAFGPLSIENVNRLKPGYDEFYKTLDDIGCTMCHSATEDPSPERNPAKFDAFVITPNNYFKTRNIIALVSLVDLKDINRSKLLAKAQGKLPHRGKEDLPPDEKDLEKLREALNRWIHSLDELKTTD